MTRDPQTNIRSSSDAPRGVNGSVPEIDSHGRRILERIVAEAASGHCDRALAIAREHDTHEPSIVNAAGVCLLRLGRAHEAVALYRCLLLTSGRTSMRHDRPSYITLNYATALLVSGQPAACLEVLEDTGDQSPTAKRLREAIKRWELTLSFGQKLDWWINHVAPTTSAVPIDFVPGDFGSARSADSPSASAVLPPQSSAPAYGSVQSSGHR